MAAYDQLTEYTAFPCHYARLKWLFETIQAQAGGKPVRILDVGCGTGNITIPLGLIPNSEVVGIDMHQGNLDVSQSRNTLPNVRFEFSFLQDYKIDTFDYIILTEVLEHIPGYFDIYEYIQKHAAPNMHLLITIPNGRGPFEISMQPLYLMRKMGMNNFIWKIKNLLGKKEPYSQNYDTPHVNFFTLTRMRREFERFNMVIAQLKKAYVLAPVIETYLPFIPLHKIARADNTLASALPAFMASGWYFDIVFKKS